MTLSLNESNKHQKESSNTFNMNSSSNVGVVGIVAGASFSPEITVPVDVGVTAHVSAVISTGRNSSKSNGVNTQSSVPKNQIQGLHETQRVQLSSHHRIPNQYFHKQNLLIIATK